MLGSLYRHFVPDKCARMSKAAAFAVAGNPKCHRSVCGPLVPVRRAFAGPYFGLRTVGDWLDRCTKLGGTTKGAAGSNFEP
jgi:hypothetical protein